jgi:hypothetical protein
MPKIIVQPRFARQRIFTGMRNYKEDSPINEASPGYPYGCTTNKECNDYKSGVLYLGYKNQRAGLDHYKIGHAFQNVVAHTWITKQQRLPWTENNYGVRPNRFYGGTFFNNPFSNW